MLPSMPQHGGREVRLAELIAALSLSTDLGNGMPLERTMRTCLIAVRVGAELGLTVAQLSDTYYLALLRSIGCTAFAHEEAAAFGDDINFRNTYFPVDFGRQEEVVERTRSHLALQASEADRARAVDRFFADGPRLASEMATTACGVAERFASRLRMGAALRRGLTQIWERWDGLGFPNGLAGEAIEISARLVHLANVVEIDHRVGAQQLALENVRRRRGGWFEPAIVDAFLACAPKLLTQVETESAWDAVLEAEPAPHMSRPVAGLEEVALAFGDFVDLKSPHTLGHSSAVSRLAESAASVLGLGEDDCLRLRHAGLLHDLGRVGVSNGIWDKPGPLSLPEWELVRLHPYYTERILSQSPTLAPLARLAGMHHERLDGSGYHRGAVAAQQTTLSRILAAADACQAMTEERPHRPPLAAAVAASHLAAEVSVGRLDREAVGAVLEASGQKSRRTRSTWPARLTDREVEVLRLLSRGRSQKEIAESLYISESTVHSHVLHVYEKTSVRTRAGIALFAMENDLIHP
jgi:HD-GYP domain-containing protein (c-di-GMP phosphodiesterase class II)